MTPGPGGKSKHEGNLMSHWAGTGQSILPFANQYAYVELMRNSLYIRSSIKLH